jgi:cytochrome c oxidase cbb3-type subunit 3/ubiquinol-cytochrome c reductase cytochrome c subunit
MRVATRRFVFHRLILTLAALVLAGCDHIPGRPGPGPEVIRPDEVLDFPTLYKTNCAGCHGESGRNGAAISLANPVYLAVAGEDKLQQVTAKGVPGKLMPGFAQSAGGMLTDRQINVLAQGMVNAWSKPDILAGQGLPSYSATLTGDAGRGAETFGAYCSRCHGASGEGGKGKVGSIVNGSYLALISDQGLRSIVIAGRPDEGMPDWRTFGAQPMTDQQISDVVAWLASKRVADPGQPYGTGQLHSTKP